MFGLGVLSFVIGYVYFVCGRRDAVSMKCRAVRQNVVTVVLQVVAVTSTHKVCVPGTVNGGTSHRSFGSHAKIGLRGGGKVFGVLIASPYRLSDK